MKKLFFLLLPLLLLCSGCFSTTEEILVRQNGSGLYGVTMDFSGLFDLVEAMSGDEAPEALKELQQEKDTVIRFAHFTDTATRLSAADKALMHDATLHLVMQQAQKKFLMELAFPFKKLADVERIMQLTQSNGSMLAKVFGAPEAGAEQPGMPDMNAYFSYTLRPGLVEKKVDSAKLKIFREAPQYQQLKSASGMLGDATISSVIRLPRAAKKVEGANATPSDGGKTVTIAASLSDVIDNPNALTFRIEY